MESFISSILSFCFHVTALLLVSEDVNFLAFTTMLSSGSSVCNLQILYFRMGNQVGAAFTELSILVI